MKEHRLSLWAAFDLTSTPTMHHCLHHMEILTGSWFVHWSSSSSVVPYTMGHHILRMWGNRLLMKALSSQEVLWGSGSMSHSHSGGLTWHSSWKYVILFLWTGFSIPRWALMSCLGCWNNVFVAYLQITTRMLLLLDIKLSIPISTWCMAS